MVTDTLFVCLSVCLPNARWISVKFLWVNLNQVTLEGIKFFVINKKNRLTRTCKSRFIHTGSDDQEVMTRKYKVFNQQKRHENRNVNHVLSAQDMDL